MTSQPIRSPEDFVPALPTEIRNAQDQGNLVLFCGAGVSCDAGLPLFPGLVNDIYKTIPGHVADEREQTALDNGEFDRALHILESKLRNNEVRAATIARLSQPPKTLAVHKALLQIAQQADGVHLVTTNFDNFFPEALKQLAGMSTEIDAAPKLPVPKSKKWNSVVHLHGLINNKTDPEGRRLVLTSADFGASYLTERWASRFVSELIRRYTILFVGYKADDVVMRYILDALDADMRLNEQVYRPFAFAGYNPDESKEEQLSSWKAKLIKPIPYPKIGTSHAVLAACLKNWANDWKDGRQGKASIVESLASSQPDLPPPERERLLWALSDPSGVPAKHLTVKVAGETLPRAPVGWIDEFFKAGLLSASINGEKGGPKDRFFGARDTELGLPISDRDVQFLVWLRAHLPSIELYRRVAAAGGSLHPYVAQEIRRDVVDRSITIGKADLAEAWSVATSPAMILSPSQVMQYYSIQATCTSIKRWHDKAWIDNEIEYALTPFLRISDPEEQWRLDAAFGFTETDRSTQDYISAELVLRCGDRAHEIVTALTGKETLLARFTKRAAALLERALDLSLINPSIDPTSFAIRRIQLLSSNTRGNAWEVLTGLAWSTFLACQTRDPAEAAATYDAWTRSPHATHRRLTIKAAAESTILTPVQRLNALIQKP